MKRKIDLGYEHPASENNLDTAVSLDDVLATQTGAVAHESPDDAKHILRNAWDGSAASAQSVPNPKSWLASMGSAQEKQEEETSSSPLIPLWRLSGLQSDPTDNKSEDIAETPGSGMSFDILSPSAFTTSPIPVPVEPMARSNGPKSDSWRACFAPHEERAIAYDRPQDPERQEAEACLARILADSGESGFSQCDLNTGSFLPPTDSVPDHSSSQFLQGRWKAAQASNN